MRARGKQSLNRKLTLIVIASVMAAVAVIAIGSVWQEARRHTEGKLEYLNATAAVFASATSRAVADGDAQSATHALRGVARAPHLLYARVEGAGGVRLAELGSGVSLDSDAKYGGGHSSTLTEALFSRTIKVIQPIVQGGMVVGHITLVADNSDLLGSVLMALTQTLIGAAIALFIAVIVAARLQRWVVQPLLRLTDTVREISRSHDYNTRVQVETDDEVGDLCGGFNVMLSEIKDRERRITDLALHDVETDLPNRIAFERAIADRLNSRNTRSLMVGVLGVERFQYVRGVIGYHLANDLLTELGAKALEMGAVAVARISTDSVGILLQGRDAATNSSQAEDILADAARPMLLGENTIEVGVSLGAAIYGVHADSPQSLIERANVAMDQARAARTRSAVFNEEAYLQTAGNLSLMTEMLRGLANDEISLALQPKYDIRTGDIRSAEMLARWRHPTRGQVAPDVFVRMAEETGGITELTEWVLREALACQARLEAAGVEIALAVNISGRLLGEPDFIERAAHALRQASGQIYLEITETATIHNQDKALLYIEKLIEAGALISIDDYGVGLSSLSYLRRIPAHELKIDKAFVHLLGERQRDALLVKSTIDLAHSLGMKVTAEGVETEASLAALAAMGCDCAQGYLIAKPMSEAEFVSFFHTHHEAEARRAIGEGQARA